MAGGLRPVHWARFSGLPLQREGAALAGPWDPGDRRTFSQDLPKVTQSLWESLDLLGSGQFLCCQATLPHWGSSSYVELGTGLTWDFPGLLGFPFTRPFSLPRAAISRDPFYEMLAARKKKVSSMKRH